MAAPEREETFKVTDRRRRMVEDETPPPRVAEPAPAADEGDSLAGLFSMIANSAAIALSEGDPAQAAELINALGLLRKKTEGNRTAQETQVLDELTHELQVRYVEVMKRSG